MVDLLVEAESLCRQTLEISGSLKNLPSESSTILKNVLQNILIRIVESKKKIMVRSPQGRGLSTEVLNNASKLYELIANLLKSRVDDKTVEEISNKLRLLEESVEKLEIYWKSFEYVTT